MLDTIKRIYQIMTPRQQKQLPIVISIMIGMGLMQIAGIGSILPFVKLLTNKNLVHENHWISLVYANLGFNSPDTFLIFVGIMVLVLLVLGNMYSAFTIWVISRYTWNFHRDLSQRAIRQYLFLPYTDFLERNSSELGKNILMECAQLSFGIFSALLQLATSGATAAFIITFMLILSPELAFLAVITFGSAYIIIFFLIRHSLQKIGYDRIDINTERFKVVSEAFGSIKELKVLGRESEFLNYFYDYSHRFSRVMEKHQVINQLPRFLIEATGFGLIMLLILYHMIIKDNLQEFLPLISVFALAGYRLLPAMQQLYFNFSYIHSDKAVLDLIYRDVINDHSVAENINNRDNKARLSVHNELIIKNITFTYPKAKQKAINDISIVIPHKSFVALVGPSGAGKTTLADIILGLLQPDSGQILVDGVCVEKNNLRQWQNNLGYVPQDIFLVDDTIKANIALGIPKKDIDQSAIERAAKLANIHEFIMEKTNHGYDTIVGEKGLRISGGQRQRIGIARALYHDPDVLVLDEATSSLDVLTEAAVHKAIIQTAKTKTVILIAHRLTSIRDCNKIFLLEEGSIIAQGTFQELVDTNKKFMEMIKTGTFS